MTSLDFLFIALGIGFLVLVVFISVFLLHTIIILRDVNKVTDNAKEISERVKKMVIEPIEFIAEITKNVGSISEMIKNFKNRQFSKRENAANEKETKKKHPFRINKIQE